MNHTNRNKTEEIYKISIPIINLVGEDSERPLRFNGIFVSVCVDLDVCLVKMFNFLCCNLCFVVMGELWVI